MKNSKFFQKLAENWKVKVFCVLCAIGIYLLCQVSLLDKRTFAVPLTIKEEGNLNYTETLPRYVRVIVKGESSDISLLQDDDFSTYLDLSTYSSEGKYRIPILLDLSKKASTIEKFQVVIEPEYINLNLEPNVTTMIPLKINISGECAAGYEISETKISPNLVEVTGPVSLVNGTKYIETNAVDVTGKSYVFSKSVNAVNQNNRLKLTGNKSFKVTININPVKGKKEFNTGLVFYKNLPENLGIKNDILEYSLILSGTLNDLEKFTLSPETIFVDCSSITNTGIYELPLAVTLPEGFNLDKINPEKISVEVINKEDMEKEVSEGEVGDVSELESDSGSEPQKISEAEIKTESEKNDKILQSDKSEESEISSAEEKEDVSDEVKKVKKKGFFSRG